MSFLVLLVVVANYNGTTNSREVISAGISPDIISTSAPRDTIPSIEKHIPKSATYNYGNIRKTATSHWKGMVDCPGEFVCFKDAYHAIRAMNVLLNTYDRKYGINTIQEIVARWAPANENQTNKLVALVSTFAGLPPNLPIRSQLEPENRVSLLYALIRMEGEGPVHELEIREVVYGT